jgi:hypothetical protein
MRDDYKADSVASIIKNARVVIRKNTVSVADRV